MMDRSEFVTKEIIAQDEAKLTSEGRERLRKAAQFERAELLGFWKICPKAACRRARSCAADPDFCVERFELLVNEKARTAVETLMYARMDGYSFDEGCESTPPGSLEEYEVWLANLFRPEAPPVTSQACEEDGEDRYIANSNPQA